MSRGDLAQFEVPWNGALQGTFTDGLNWTSNGTLLFQGPYAAIIGNTWPTGPGFIGLSSPGAWNWINLSIVDGNGIDHSSQIEDYIGHPAPAGMLVVVNLTRSGSYIYGPVTDNGSYGSGGQNIPPIIFESLTIVGHDMTGDASAWENGDELTVFYFAGATTVTPPHAKFVMSLAAAGSAAPNAGTWTVGDSTVAFDAAPTPTGWTTDGGTVVTIYDGTPSSLTSIATGPGQSPPSPFDTSTVQMLSSGDGVNSTINNVSFAQDWALDATGNWSNFRQLDTTTAANNLDQQRTSNQVNEITGLAQRYGATWVTPAYDRAGNMTTIPGGNNPTIVMGGTYDAWNRLVSISGVATYAYDGTNRRITQTVSGTTRHYYYSSQWQVLEERVGTSTTPDRQFVWGQRYIDDLVCRDRSTTGTLNERLYALQDANWNVTAVTNTSGVVQQRYSYSPYGVVTILNPDFTPWTGTDTIGFEYLYCGYRWDAASGLYQVRWRYLQSPLGVWITRDPGEYVNGMGVYRYGINSGINVTDPFGLDIYLKEGNNTGNIINDVLHRQVCVDTWKQGECKYDRQAPVCFSFGAPAKSEWFPKRQNEWLGWKVIVLPGIVFPGKIYIAADVGPKIIKQKKTTVEQDKTWLAYMVNIRKDTPGPYRLITHNCRRYSELEFGDAPGN
jgi:RHS repeat-associated protein